MLSQFAALPQQLIMQLVLLCARTMCSSRPSCASVVQSPSLRRTVGGSPVASLRLPSVFLAAAAVAFRLAQSQGGAVAFSGMATAPRGRSLRVVSYNICGLGAGFGPPDNEKVTTTYGLLRADMQRLKPHVLCLQEARRLPLTDPEGQARADSLDALASDLGMTLTFAHATPGFEKFGNAILVSSDLQLLGSASLHLNGGSVVKTPAGKNTQIVRGCVGVHLAFQSEHSSEDQDCVQFAVLATHWDHIAESERLVQATHVLDFAKDSTGGLPHLLEGDLNAMKRSDYTPDEWAALEERNRQRSWAPLEDSSALAALEAAGK
mmetsp:Transcript_154527/g.495354  ORF Transcript_154527/g.495354 Transcript_154527/m.495354 type:complete len:321 (+) Transcript_154527:17-979(+)